MKALSSRQSGFTLVEVLLVIALAGMLVSFSSISLANTQQTTTVATASESLISDSKSQQTKAMLGRIASGSTSANYGIHIDSDGYTLFTGTYSPGNTSNLKVTLDGITLSTTFAGSQIVFQQITGEVSGFTNGQNTITLTDVNGYHPKTITITKYGVVR